MHSKRLFSLVLALTLILGSVLGANAQVNNPVRGPGSVIYWNQVARDVTITSSGLPAAHSLIYIAYVQAAVYNAVAAIDGGYEQYKANLERSPGASIDAAVATAAHDVLVHYFPAHQADLDAKYEAALAEVNGNGTKAMGIEVGRQAAAALIALRQNDGLEADIHFMMPAPAPGVWQLPMGVGPQTPWVSEMRPFTIDRPDQFRVDSPTDLTSNAWALDFNEVKDWGGLQSAYRIPKQTETARFWGVNPIAQSQTTLERLAQRDDLHMDAMDAARLFAMADLIGADALIACWAAKYTHLFWRPAFAIPQGDSDGNPDTAGDPTWAPLLGTPNHPEYPSAHGCMTGAQAEVFAAFFGTDQINVDIFAKLSPQAEELRHHFDSVVDLQQEITNARIWGGLHYRQSMEKGLETAHNVAQLGLSRYFLPAR